MEWYYIIESFIGLFIYRALTNSLLKILLVLNGINYPSALIRYDWFPADSQSMAATVEEPLYVSSGSSDDTSSDGDDDDDLDCLADERPPSDCESSVTLSSGSDDELEIVTNNQEADKAADQQTSADIPSNGRLIV